MVGTSVMKELNWAMNRNQIFVMSLTKYLQQVKQRWWQSIATTTHHSSTTLNIIIFPNFMVWKFCRKTQFSHSFRRLARNYAETVSLHTTSTPWNEMKLRYTVIMHIQLKSLFKALTFQEQIYCIVLPSIWLYLITQEYIHTAWKVSK